ncbi:methyltransferase-like protein 2 isoform X2 [Cryptomeria japonica]|uniref:methyltransferase-like protein 2 isoform X2 n=1 Tax=Cryptomeria japonica TaxID=3369 RepID=UPI0027DA3B3D|nr:methyltransferase-like protein 2 isoform X2 [Cryptomeria japonica]
MEGNASNKSLFQDYLSTGIYRFPNVNAVFLDPVRILNISYTNFSISPHLYYTRSLPNPCNGEEKKEEATGPKEQKDKKRKRKTNNSYVPNAKEELAHKRHMEVRPFLSSAYEAFLKEPSLLSILCSLKDNTVYTKADNALVDNRQENDALVDNKGENIPSFIELGKLWQAPLFEISFHRQVREESVQGEIALQEDKNVTCSLFNTLIENRSNDDAITECLSSCYILPRRSSFLMSDINQIRRLIPACPHDRFNLILVDPPWENKSVHRRSIYPTLPNRYLFSIPIRQLAHPEGALVALWVTNREKLRTFVEEELFPAWGITYAASLYWLKVREDGHMISELDLAHHKPYECILVGYIHKQGNDVGHKLIAKMPPDKHVVISVPGDHSRKPPIGRPKPVRGLELFARELSAGWTSWGNEPLFFQQSRYFSDGRLQSID